MLSANVEVTKKLEGGKNVFLRLPAKEVQGLAELAWLVAETGGSDESQRPDKRLTFLTARGVEG